LLPIILGRTKQLLEDVATEIVARGGTCVPAQVDHSNDAEVEAFFKRVEKDENGKLDVLVNNAYAAVSTIFENVGKPFWTLDPIDQWDTVNGVGLRNHYLCTVFASR
jgi:dehydrogenase/reductase SDR family protein 1